MRPGQVMKRRCECNPRSWVRVLFQGLFGIMNLAGLLRADEVSDSAPMRVFENNGKAHVSISSLAQKARVAVKSLPGQDQFVACKEDRCVLVKDFYVFDGETYIAINPLAESMNAKVIFDRDHTTARIEFSKDPVPTSEGTVRVGQLAPDFRLTRLDGSSIALSDLRGRRVLINSWASW